MTSAGISSSCKLCAKTGVDSNRQNSDLLRGSVNCCGSRFDNKPSMPCNQMSASTVIEAACGPADALPDVTIFGATEGRTS